MKKHNLETILDYMVSALSNHLKRFPPQPAIEYPIRIDILPPDLERGFCFYYSVFEDDAITLHIVARALYESPLDQFMWMYDLRNSIDDWTLPVHLTFLDCYHGNDELARLTTMLTYRMTIGGH